MTKPGFAERRLTQWKLIMEQEFNSNVGDEGLFPNHTDKDIWMAGFEAGYQYISKQLENQADDIGLIGES